MACLNDVFLKKCTGTVHIKAASKFNFLAYRYPLTVYRIEKSSRASNFVPRKDWKDDFRIRNPEPPDPKCQGPTGSGFTTLNPRQCCSFFDLSPIFLIENEFHMLTAEFYVDCLRTESHDRCG
jgi:hypothetical protein